MRGSAAKAERSKVMRALGCFKRLYHRIESRPLTEFQQPVGFLQRRDDLRAVRSRLRLLAGELAGHFLRLRLGDDEHPPVAGTDRRLLGAFEKLAHRHRHRLQLGEVEQPMRGAVAGGEFDHGPVELSDILRAEHARQARQHLASLLIGQGEHSAHPSDAAARLGEAVMILTSNSRLGNA